MPGQDWKGLFGKTPPLHFGELVWSYFDPGSRNCPWRVQKHLDRWNGFGRVLATNEAIQEPSSSKIRRRPAWKRNWRWAGGGCWEVQSLARATGLWSSQRRKKKRLNGDYVFCHFVWKNQVDTLDLYCNLWLARLKFKFTGPFGKCIRVHSPKPRRWPSPPKTILYSTAFLLACSNRMERFTHCQPSACSWWQMLCRDMGGGRSRKSRWGDTLGGYDVWWLHRWQAQSLQQRSSRCSFSCRGSCGKQEMVLHERWFQWEPSSASTNCAESHGIQQVKMGETQRLGWVCHKKRHVRWSALERVQQMQIQSAGPSKFSRGKRLEWYGQCVWQRCLQKLLG